MTTQEQMSRIAGGCDKCCVWAPDDWFEADKVIAKLKASGNYRLVVDETMPEVGPQLWIHTLRDGLKLSGPGFSIPLHTDWLLCTEHEALWMEELQ